MKNGIHLRSTAVLTLMLTIQCMSLLPVILFYQPAHSEISADAYSASMGNARSIHGGGTDAAVFNPALLGAELGPRNGIRLIPLTSLCVGIWSDKFALTPYKEYLTIMKDSTWQRIVNQILVSTFDIAETSPEESSERIRDKIKGGASVYTGATLPLLGITFNHWSLDIRTGIHSEITLPDAPFLLLFSDTDGLREGANLSLSNLGVQARVTTDITVAYGIPFNLSELINRINDLTRGTTDFSCASFGGGFTFSLGHNYVNLETVDGGIHYDEAPEGLYLEGTVRLKSAGPGLQPDWDFNNPFEGNLGFAGWGAGINAGVLLYGEHSAVSLSISRLGPMFWNNVVEGEFDIRTRDLTLAPLFETDDINLFDPEAGGMLPDETDTLTIINSYASWMPTRLTIGFSYRFDFRHHEKKAVRILANYVNTTLEYEQSLAPWPGRSFIPRVTVAAENGFLRGIVPIRAGFIFGGHERLASTIGFGIGLSWFRIEAAYKAIGTTFWYPRNGFECAAGLRSEWGRFRDPDGDGIDNRTDRAPYISEDMDGFEDEDGIPDPDNDKDSIIDSADSCVDIPEDRDGFSDTDGCPEYDNDADGIADTLDACPLEAEDKDSFRDGDGCPDPDNDADGIPDTSDKCPNEPEDVDGVADDDGCPKEVSDFSEPFKKNLDTLISRISFSTATEFSMESSAALDSLAQLLRQYTSDYLVFWSDTTVSDSLCHARSQATIRSFSERGVSMNQLVVPIRNPNLYISLNNVSDYPLEIKLLLPANHPSTVDKTKQKEQFHR